MFQNLKNIEATIPEENVGKLPCSCRASIQNRIVNGRFASSRSYPWLVSVQSKASGDPQNLHGCGATIINEFWLLTAGKFNCVNKLISFLN